MDHLLQYLQMVGDEHASYSILLQGIVSDLVNAIFRDGQTALEVACHRKDWKLVRALVDAGADVNASFRGMHNAFITSFIQWEEHRLTLHAGEDSDIRVALHAACYYEAKDVVYFLLEKGADPNIPASEYGMGTSSLLYAADMALSQETAGARMLSH
ncbi:hypothetical protein FA13DRAFT_76170 [Coprinellus micaceus]|uniref:Uncharacterized protein n=1 Tax=Coprinellus micaceus TaxID=71717 RepID=A0A4Y7TJ96_COPMI|nr:hypothetical protein FA13DRAFT_76170 [Coprinellus micaceus]